MNVADRFKTGLNIGSDSFGLLWKYKKLIIYFGAPVLLGITIELIFYNLSFVSQLSSAIFIRGLMTEVLETFGWSRHFVLILAEIVRTFVTAYAAVMLVTHTSKIIQNKKTTIKKSFIACLPIYKKMISWTVITTIVFFIIHRIDLLVAPGAPIGCRFLGTTASLLSRGTWSLFTLFVIPALALKKLPLKKIIQNSPHVTHKVFFEYIGAIFWIGLVALLAYTPFLLLLPRTAFFLTIVYAVLALISLTLSTVHAIVKTRLYIEPK